MQLNNLAVIYLQSHLSSCQWKIQIILTQKQQQMFIKHIALLASAAAAVSSSLALLWLRCGLWCVNKLQVNTSLFPFYDCWSPENIKLQRMWFLCADLLGDSHIFILVLNSCSTVLWLPAFEISCLICTSYIQSGSSLA